MQHISQFQSQKPGKLLNIFIVSLGCPKNLVDTEELLGQILSENCRIIQNPLKADLILINTCGFIQSALEESLGVIGEIIDARPKKHKKGKKTKIVVFGCLVARIESSIKEIYPEIDACFGVRDWENLQNILQEWFPDHISHNDSTNRVIVTEPHLAYLRIADGCNNRCSYCTIPLIRGPYHSRPIEEIVSEANNLVENGVFEIILLAQDTSRYGSDIYKSPKLVELIKELDKIEKLGWLRLMYLHPDRIDKNLLEEIAASKKVCRYLDIPFQHVSSKILKKMGRMGNYEKYTDLLGKIKSYLPDAAIRTTFMVGFPTETDEDFGLLCEFVQKMEFDAIGIFAYSLEGDTPAAHMEGQVSEDIKYKRLEQLQEIAIKTSERKLDKYLGQKVNVLIDKSIPDNKNFLLGRWEGQAPDVDGVVYIPEKFGNPGDFVEVELEKRVGPDLIAKFA